MVYATAAAGRRASGCASAWSAAGAMPSSAPSTASPCASTTASRSSPARCRPTRRMPPPQPPISASRPSRSYADYRDDGDGRGGAARRHRGGRDRHPEPPARADRHRLPRGRHRRHLRQAAVDDARPTPRRWSRWPAPAAASFVVTLNNTGYAMVRQAREMVAAGELGRLVAVHGAYIQDWLTSPIDADGQKQAEWRTDPARAGQSAVLADIGVHAFNLATFVSGLRGRGGGGRSVHRRARPAARRQRPCAAALDGRRARHDPGQPDLARPLQRPVACASTATRPGSNGRRGRPEELRFSPYGEETPHAGARRPSARRRRAALSRACRRPTPRAISRPSPISTATPPTSSARIAAAWRSTPPSPPAFPTSRPAPRASASSPPRSPRRPPTVPGRRRGRMTGQGGRRTESHACDAKYVTDNAELLFAR